MGIEEIKLKTGIDLAGDTTLYSRLSAHERVVVLGNTFKYKPQHNIYDKVSLLSFIRDHKTGTLLADITDCYKAVMEDVHALQKERKILYMSHPDPTLESLFPLDMMELAVDEDVNSMFHEQVLPVNVQDLQAAVVKAGLKSALAQVPLSKRPVQSQKDRKRHRAERAVDINKATNKHLPSLFSGAQPKGIDS